MKIQPAKLVASVLFLVTTMSSAHAQASKPPISPTLWRSGDKISIHTTKSIQTSGFLFPSENFNRDIAEDIEIQITEVQANKVSKIQLTRTEYLQNKASSAKQTKSLLAKVTLQATRIANSWKITHFSLSPETPNKAFRESKSTYSARIKARELIRLQQLELCQFKPFANFTTISAPDNPRLNYQPTFAPRMSKAHSTLVTRSSTATKISANGPPQYKVTFLDHTKNSAGGETKRTLNGQVQLNANTGLCETYQSTATLTVWLKQKRLRTVSIHQRSKLTYTHKAVETKQPKTASPKHPATNTATESN